MKNSILSLLLLALLTSCGNKHTYDIPNSKDELTVNQKPDQNQNSNLKEIVLISPHEDPADYYSDEIHVKYLSKISKSNTIDPKDLQNLKSELNKILKWEHTRIEGKRDSLERCPKNTLDSNNCYSHDIETYRDYQVSRKYLFGSIHLLLNHSGNYALDTIYCQQRFESSDLGNPQYTIGVMQIPDYNTINAEHIWPRSNFEEEKGTDYYDLKVADLHNLSPATARVNRDRSNYPFGDATEDSIILNDISEYCSNSNAKVFSKDGKIYFEAPDEVKGDVARAMFYVSTRYYNSKNPTAMNIDPQQEATLREWHRLDPVSDEERERNNNVFSIQHNRNPFVDYPELVDLISDF